MSGRRGAEGLWRGGPGAGTSRGGERAPAAEQPAQPAPGVPAVGYMKGAAYGCGVEHDAMNGWWFLSFCGTMASRPAILLSRTATHPQSSFMIKGGVSLSSAQFFF